MGEQMNTLKQLVEELKEKREKTALIHRTEFRKFEKSYSQIFQKACQFANLLESKGLKKGDKVLIQGPNSPSWVYTLLGCILKGVVAVPLDLKSRKRTVKKIKEEVEAELFLKTRYSDHSDLKIEKLVLEDIPEKLESYGKDLPEEEIGPEDTAEIIYTSGTTGEPKGVVLTHRNVTSNIKDLQELPVKETDRFLSLLPLSHIFEQTIGLFLPLSVGGSITYIPSLKSENILGSCQKDGITVIVMVPRVLDIFRQSIETEMDEKGLKNIFKKALNLSGNLPRRMRKLLFKPVHAKFGTSLRYIVSGGAPLDTELEEFWKNMGFEILQGYGLTETSPVLTYNRPGETRTGSVGKEMANIELRVAEDGEIEVKGDSVFKGYFRKPGKNKEKFQNGWFRTGDMGRKDEDGYLYINGRKKNVIVTEGGRNIFPTDIEHILNRQPSIKESCVIGLEGRSGERVHAVLLPEDRNSFRPGNVVERANQELNPAQQIQGYKVWPEEDFPRTPTMKIRRFKVKEKIVSDKEEKPFQKNPGINSQVFKVLKNLVENPGEIEPGAEIGSDLGLSSIDRVELVSLLEREINVYVDETRIDPETTVSELERIVEEKTEKVDNFPRWSLSLPATIIRWFLQKILLFPLVRLFTKRIEVRGKENLEKVEGPVIFAPNHQSHLDTPAILINLESPARSVSVAAMEEYFKEEKILRNIFIKLIYFLNVLIINIYPFSQEKNIRESLKYTGELLDMGQDIILFPEGQRSTDKELEKFERGIGFIAKNMEIPIIPVGIEGTLEILPRGSFWPRKGSVKVSFGEPLEPGNFSELEIVKELREKIEKLRKN